jgi:hypothetical protein
VPIFLRNKNTAVSGNPRDGKSIHSRFSKSSQHCMAKEMHYKVLGKISPFLALYLEHADPLMKMVSSSSVLSQ